MSEPPTEPGYYWAKLKTPSGGNFYCGTLPPEINGVRVEPETDEDGLSAWRSVDWEIVEVNVNDPYGDRNGDKFFSVQVFGLPVTQWVPDFHWGPRVREAKP